MFSNPLIVSYRRLAHRAGVWPILLMIVIAGGVLLYIQSYWLSARAGQGVNIGYYLAVLGAQALFFVLPWMTKVSQAVMTERKDGLLETNWLTPQHPSQLAVGYLVGPATAEFYAFAVSVPITFAVAWQSDLPLWFWAGTQLLVFTTGLMAGLLGLVGSAVVRTGAGGGFAVLLFFGMSFVFAAGALGVPNFVLPVNLAVEWFVEVTEFNVPSDWFTAPNMFGVELSAAFLTAVAHLVAYGWLWVAALRKFADPDQKALTNWMAIAVFACIVVPQHGLVWRLTGGRFPVVDAPRLVGPMLAVVHVAAMVLGFITVMTHLLNPQHVRRDVLGGRYAGLAPVFSRSAVWLAVRLSIIYGAGFFSLCYDSVAGAPWHFLLPVLNMLFALTILALILETSIVWFGAKFARVGVLGIFVVFLLPIVFLALGGNPDALPIIAVGWLTSPLTAGASLVGAPSNSDVGTIRAITGGHAILGGILGVAWAMGWSIWLRRHCTPEQSTSSDPLPLVSR